MQRSAQITMLEKKLCVKPLKNVKYQTMTRVAEEESIKGAIRGRGEKRVTTL